MLSTIKLRFGRPLPVDLFAPGSRRRWRLRMMLLLMLGTCGVGHLQAVDLGACMEDRCGPQVCAANDVNLVLVGLGVQDDGCVGPDDTVDIWLRSIANTTTGQTRYDVSMWFATDGDPDGDGARSGQCAVEILTPAATLQASAPACYAEPDNGGVDFNCGLGPFLNADGDACGDITKGGNLPDCGREVDVTKPPDSFTCSDPDGVGDATVMDFQETITFPCTDTYDPANSPPDGFVDLPYCITWHNQSDSGDCDFPDTPICPSQVSKCTCETGAGAATNIPAPDLGLSCSCTPSLSTAPTPVTCTVTYTNPDTTPACNYDLNTVERFRCGTAAYVYFDADYDELNGVLSNVAAGGAYGGTTAFETGVDPSSGKVIRWTPHSREGTPAIIGPGDTGSLVFTYTPDENVSGQMVFPVSTYWSDSDDFDPNVLQKAAATTCSFDLDPTWAMVTDFRVEQGADGVVVLWETAAEAATLGFHVERFDPSSATWQRVNTHLLPAARHVPGGHYRLVDSAAPDAGKLTYRVIEVEATGASRTYGPYDVPVAQQTTRSASAAAFAAEAKGPSARILDHIAAGAKTAGIDPADGSGMIKILVRENGLYGVAAADLATALDMSVRQVEKLIVKGQLRLSTAGSPVAWTPSNDRTELLFYGEAPAGNLSPENVYWIERGPGLLMKTESLSRPYSEPPPEPQTFVDAVDFEQDLFPMISVAADPMSDFWTWDGVLAGDPTYGSADFEIDVDGVADTTSDGVMTLRLWGLAGDPASPNHHARVTLNGVVIGDEMWDGEGDRVVELAAGQSLIEEGRNVVGVEAILGNFFVDSIGLRYERLSRAADDRLLVPAGDEVVVGVGGFSTPEISAYELSDPRRPVRVTLGSVTTGPTGDYFATFRRSSDHATYLVVGDPAIRSDAEVVVDVASDLRSPGNRGEYLVIAPRELADAAALLADYRTSRTLETLVVQLDDIMDEFNSGASSPLAIKSFLVYAYLHWAVPPRYVALAGKGSFDYKDHLGLGGNLIPPMLAPSAGGLVSADLRLGDVIGDDGIPEIAVGRIPVLDSGELESYIAKITAYEADQGGEWRDRVVMVADNPDFAGDFPTDSNALAAILPADAVVERVYLYQPYSPGEARDRIVAAVNDGAAVLNYVGHGGSDQFAAESMLDLDDVALMLNHERLPVVTAFTCYLAIFDYPGYISLGEELVVHADGGAAAVWGPTGMSGNLRALELGEHAMAALYGPEERLGDAVVETMRAFVEGGGNVGHVDVYSLLGDPALELSRERHGARPAGEWTADGGIR